MLESHRQPTVYVDSNYDTHARNKSERRPEKIEEGCGRRIAIGMTYGGERFGQAPGDAYQRRSGVWVAIAFKTGFCFTRRYFGAEIIFHSPVDIHGSGHEMAASKCKMLLATEDELS